MDDIYAKAYDEAQRLMETCFSYCNPYTCIIEDDGIPFDMQDKFYSLVEEELQLKGEKITREGKYFKINKHQK